MNDNDMVIRLKIVSIGKVPFQDEIHGSFTKIGRNAILVDHPYGSDVLKPRCVLIVEDAFPMCEAVDPPPPT